MPGLKPPVEAQLLDLADEIAYNTADLDDAFGADIVTLEQIASASPYLAERIDEAENMFPGASPRLIFNEVLRALINHLVGGLIEGTLHQATVFNLKSMDDVRNAPRRIAEMTETTAGINRQVKQFLSQTVYESSPLIYDREQAARKVAWMFQFLVDHPGHVSAGFREALDTTPVPRVVCDYIAGMTDAYFFRTYESLAQ